MTSYKKASPFDPDFEGLIVPQSSRFSRLLRPATVAALILGFLICFCAVRLQRELTSLNQSATLVELPIPAQDADPKAAPEPLLNPNPFASH